MRPQPRICLNCSKGSVDAGEASAPGSWGRGAGGWGWTFEASEAGVGAGASLVRESISGDQWMPLAAKAATRPSLSTALM